MLKGVERMKNYITTNEELSKNLKRERKKARITQQQMADQLGMERSSYTYHELGYIQTSILTIIKIAKILNVELERLICKESD